MQRKEVWFEERIRDEEEGWRVWGAQEFSKNEEKKKQVRDGEWKSLNSHLFL